MKSMTSSGEYYFQ